MDILLSFALGYFLNEGRILYSIFKNNLLFIKNKIIVKELGHHYLLLFFYINICKGFIFIKLLANNTNFHILILAISLLLGLYLGSKPLNLEGSELALFLGILAAYNLEDIKIILAILISLFILTKNYKISLLVVMILNVFRLFKYNYYLGYFAVFLLVNYARYYYALFSSLFNRIIIKENYSSEGVKSLYESILHTSTRFFKKCFEKSI